KGQFANSRIFAHETDFGLSQCKGTWCLHLQADEVLHEDDLDIIVQACKKYESDMRVDGFLLRFVHFWGDYEHVVESHGIIRKEIRIVRNGIGCYSYLDSISFRKSGNKKLNVIELPARIFHYSYVRPPKLMAAKAAVHDAIHSGADISGDEVKKNIFDWGPLGSLQIFKGTHPAVMYDWIARFNWQSTLNNSKPKLFEKSPHKHLRTKYRFLTWVENTFNGHNEIFGFKNYRLLKK
ncbi:MAG TPA: hypothetical protein VG603_12415, partial [Chitinophagales bacterium]|nr:hypothetical protein [Chitinophagales bacterium]